MPVAGHIAYPFPHLLESWMPGWSMHRAPAVAAALLLGTSPALRQCCTGHRQQYNQTAFNSRLSESVCKAVRESEKSKCKISMFCGTVGTDCPYVTHTHHQSSGKCTHVKGFHFAIFPCWTCQRNFAASPYTFAKNAWLNLSQMDFPHVWALIKEKKTSGGRGLLPRNVSVEAFVHADSLPVRSACLFLLACTCAAVATRGCWTLS